MQWISEETSDMEIQVLHLKKNQTYIHTLARAYPPFTNMYTVLICILYFIFYIFINI